MEKIRFSYDRIRRVRMVRWDRNESANFAYFLEQATSFILCGFDYFSLVVTVNSLNCMEMSKENATFTTGNGRHWSIGPVGLAKAREISASVDQALAYEPEWNNLAAQDLHIGDANVSSSAGSPIPEIYSILPPVPQKSATKRPYESSELPSPVKRFNATPESKIILPLPIVPHNSAFKSPLVQKANAAAFNGKSVVSPGMSASKAPLSAKNPAVPPPKQIISPKSANFETPTRTQNGFCSLATLMAGSKGIVSKSPNLVLTASELQDIAELSRTDWSDMFSEELTESPISISSKSVSTKFLLTDAERREVEEWGKINFDEDF
ncbi:uncharacterized protein LOC129584150 [Paramacrobiotus metropolitanus]|uniref:uncharacterized protein LOC129584150 n=1 Tax=Paramacrobiotus metropolitanus TaxID=2943436 RepID=UPI0024465985|nr:uncharacterized protein LOC129584150 [Paramacrobiotus metropolitanus]